MSFKYYLPDENGSKKEYETDSNTLVIIGANGSGKSKLGAWIEQQDMENVHRIGAQRNLNFQDNVPLKSYSQAEDLVFYGTAEKSWQKNKSQRWDGGRSLTTKLMDDFDNVLAALIGLTNNENAKFIKEYNTAFSRSELIHPPFTSIDKLIQIWDEIFPQRQLKFDDAKFLASMRDGTGDPYNSNQMSDGERAVLYFVAQVLCIPKNKTIIIDEPEVHLHRSIMNRLWATLEKYRSDCFFIYITHDTQFAASFGQSDKIWIKEFDGKNWKLGKIQNSELPEELLLDILGSRKKVLFVEGEKNSYDTKLYTILYPNYYVIACGSCTQVISRTKVFRNNSTLHHCEVYGLIDRDYRSDHEINKYKKEGIYTLNIAEVENIFLVEELIRLLASYLGRNPDEVVKKIKDYIVNTRFAKQIEKQICQSVVAHLKYLLSSIELSQKSDAEVKASLDAALESINYQGIKSEQEEKFHKALKECDYAGILRVFNEKGLINSIGNFFGLKNDEYCNTILYLLNGKLHKEIIEAVSKYLPTEIPRLSGNIDGDENISNMAKRSN